jgi:hypothetical protein
MWGLNPVRGKRTESNLDEYASDTDFAKSLIQPIRSRS